MSQDLTGIQNDNEFYSHQFAVQPQHLGGLQDEYYSTVMFDETYAQKDGTIKHQTQFSNDPMQWILSGPNFFVSPPFYKIPRAVCKLNADYDVLDLSTLAGDYLPRMNYIPARGKAEYQSRVSCVPRVNDGETDTKYITDYYRFIAREWCAENISDKNGQFHINTDHWQTESKIIGWEDVQTLDHAIIECTVQDDTVPNVTLNA